MGILRYTGPSLGLSLATGTLKTSLRLLWPWKRAVNVTMDQNNEVITQGHPTNSFCKISVRETKLGYTFLNLLYDKLLFSYLAGDLQSSEITEEGLPFSGIREISEEGLPFSVIFRPFKISASIFWKFQKFSPAIFCMVNFFYANSDSCCFLQILLRLISSNSLLSCIVVDSVTVSIHKKNEAYAPP